MRGTRILVVAGALCLLASTPAAAAPGAPDPSFGKGGLVHASLGDRDVGYGVVRTADGGTDVAGGRLESGPQVREVLLVGDEVAVGHPLRAQRGHRDGRPGRSRPGHGETCHDKSDAYPEGPVMRARTALLASLITVGSVAGLAEAAPKKLPCLLVTDPANDTFLARQQDQYHPQGAPYGPQEDGLDIVSADIASDGKILTAVVRLKNLAAAVATAPGGRSVDVNFTIPDFEYILYVRAVDTGGAPTFEAGFKEPLPAVTTLPTKLGDGTGVLDAKTNEVRIHVPLAVFSKQGSGIKAGKKLSIGEITTGRYAGGRGVFSDVVVAEKVYTAGAKNCVKPGK